MKLTFMDVVWMVEPFPEDLIMRDVHVILLDLDAVRMVEPLRRVQVLKDVLVKQRHMDVVRIITPQREVPCMKDAPVCRYQSLMYQQVRTFMHNNAG